MANSRRCKTILRDLSVTQWWWVMATSRLNPFFAVVWTHRLVEANGLKMSFDATNLFYRGADGNKIGLRTELSPQSCKLHGAVCVLGGQSVSASRASTVRVLVLVPPSQGLLHSLHSPQSPKLQPPSHENVLQLLVSSSSGHLWPSATGADKTLRCRVCFPPPQGAPHADHSVHSLTAQSEEQEAR